MDRGDKLALAGRFGPARDLYARTIGIDRKNVEAWVKLSAAERRLGRLRSAEQSCRQALALQPKLALGLRELGVILQCQGRIDDSLGSYDAAIALQPALPEVHYLKGNALHGLGLLADAAASYRTALAQQPRHPKAWSDLGAALIGLGQLPEAEAALQRALGLDPSAGAAVANLAALHGQCGRADEAVALYRQAIILAPGDIRIAVGLAALLERTGQLDETRTAIAGLSETSDDPELCLVRARLARREDRFSDAVALLERAAATPDRIHAGEIHLMLGQLYDRMGRPREAFSHFATGNRQIADLAAVPLNEPPVYLREVALARRYLAPAVPAPAAIDAAESAPVFLIGFPRSGTTLLEQILDSHPGLQTMDEKPAVGAMRNSFIAAGVDSPGNLDGEATAQLRKDYFAAVDGALTRRPGALLVDKLPLNIVWAHLIAGVFPQAKFVVALRHPCDVCLSCFMQNFGLNGAMQSFLSLEHTVQVYAAVMDLWRDQIQALPLQYHYVRYEDLVNAFRAEAGALLDFTGVGWNARVEDYAAHAA
ncbi:MAG: tetratricopeptide repeat-containing sulfotransferase family protein, partial [Rhodospirillaceae bacterium]